jgi:hypothetical protein
MKLPKSLIIWFKLHFIVDIIFAIPLIFFPGLFMQLLSLPVENLFLARVIGAALLGIGGASIFCKKKEHYEIMLILKIIWSISAILVLVYSAIVENSLMLWLLALVFLIFSIAWIYYYKIWHIRKN